MKQSPSVVIIILNYNGLDDTRVCLKSVLKTEYPNFRVVVVDNGSERNEARSLKEDFKDERVKFIRFARNWGFAEGNNRAIKQVKSKYVVLLNNDTVVDSKWLRELVKIAEKDERIAACQAKIRSFYEPEYFEYAGAAGGYLDKLGYPYTRGRIGFHMEKDVGQYDQEVDLFWGSGTCLLIKKQVFKECGLLSKDFFFYHEETDLCWRLKNMGHRIVFCPKALVFHKGGISSRKKIARRIFFVHRNNLLLLARNLSGSRLIWVLPTRILLDILSGVFYLMTKKPKFLIVVIYADLSFFGKIPTLVQQRGKIKKLGFMAEREMKPLSIFWEYFIRGKRRYSELFGKKSRTKIIYYEDMIDISSAVNNKNRMRALMSIFGIKI